MLISDTLSKFFNKFIEEGVYPQCLKVAEVILVLKKGNRYMTSNYRTTPWLSQFDKLFEKLIHNRIYSNAQKYNLLNKKEFEFRQNYSTIFAISHMYDS